MAYTAIDNPELYFQTVLYTGNNTDGLAITFDGDEDMSPDLIWIKSRGNAHSHCLADTVRGISNGGTKILVPDSNQIEETNDSAKGIKTADSDGFTLGAETNTTGSINGSGKTYVAWCWKESATAGFDIISYTGDGSDRDLSHSLSASPEFIIIKQRSGTQDWSTQSTALGLANYLILNGNNASAGTSGALVDAVSSSTISVDDNAYVNENTSTYIGYLWRSVQGFSAMGSYTGNGNADGTFVYTGFRPVYVMRKVATGGTGSWCPYDSAREPANVMDQELFLEDTAAEGSFTQMDILSNGFKMRTTSSAGNGSGQTYIYMAFAEAPFVNSNGVPCNAR